MSQNRQGGARSRKGRKQRQSQTLNWALLAGAVVLVIGILAIAVYQGLDDDDVAVGEGVDYAELPTDGMTLGASDAPVTLVEYADFLCIHCGDFADDGKPQLVDDFIDDGQVQLEYRPFPVLGGDIEEPENPAVRASEAAMCAADQDAFWPYHDRMFEPVLGGNADDLDEDFMREVAADLDLDQDEFNACLDENTHRENVIDSYEQGVAEGVTGTPTFFINGNPVAWTEDGYDALATQLESALDAE